MRVSHPMRGDGVVVNDLQRKDKPIGVRYDSGEEHAYSLKSATKLRVQYMENRTWQMEYKTLTQEDASMLSDGMKVSHPTRGDGVVVHALGRSDRPISVRYLSGEEHAYSVESATRLKIPRVEHRNLLIEGKQERQHSHTGSHSMLLMEDPNQPMMYAEIVDAFERSADSARISCGCDSSGLAG